MPFMGGSVFAAGGATPGGCSTAPASDTRSGVSTSIPIAAARAEVLVLTAFLAWITCLCAFATSVCARTTSK